MHQIFLVLAVLRTVEPGSWQAGLLTVLWEMWHYSWLGQENVHAPENSPTGMSRMMTMGMSTTISRMSRCRHVIHSAVQFTCSQQMFRMVALLVQQPSGQTGWSARSAIT